LKSDERPGEIYRDAEMVQEIAAQYPALFEARCLVDGGEIHHQRPHIVLLEPGYLAVMKEQKLDPVRYSGGPYNLDGLAFDYAVCHPQAVNRL